MLSNYVYNNSLFCSRVELQKLQLGQALFESDLNLLIMVNYYNLHWLVGYSIDSFCSQLIIIDYSSCCFLLLMYYYLNEIMNASIVIMSRSILFFSVVAIDVKLKLFRYPSTLWAVTSAISCDGNLLYATQHKNPVILYVIVVDNRCLDIHNNR